MNIVAAALIFEGICLGFVLGWNAQVEYIHRKCVKEGKSCPCGFNSGAVSR
jgi:hypothetical protein